MMTSRQKNIIDFALTYVLANIDHAGEFATNRPEIGTISEQELESEINEIKGLLTDKSTQP